jgi:O-antigen/teichoic acid export membrane protein
LIKIKELNLQSKRISISKKYRKILVQYSSFNYLNNLGVILVTTLDIMMIAKMVGLAETGVYSTVFFLVSATLIPFKSIIKISTPIVAEQWKYRKMNEMEELYKKVSSVSLLIGIFFFLSIWLNVEFLFAIPGKEFSQGVWVFFFLMLGRLTDMYCGINGLIFLTSKKYKYELFFTVFMILAVYLLNLWLIPKFGMTGAAISTAFAIIVYNFGRVLFIYKVYRIHLFTKKQFLLILTGLLTFIVGNFIQGLFQNELIQFLMELFVVLVFFVLPVYIFKIEEESVGYANKMWSFLRLKVTKN